MCVCIVQIYILPLLQLDLFSRQHVSITCKQSDCNLKEKLNVLVLFLPLF